MLLQVTSNCIVLLPQVHCRFGEKYRPLLLAGRGLGRHGVLKVGQQGANVLRQVVQLHPEAQLRFRSESFVQLVHPLRFRIDLEKLIAQQRLQLRWVLVPANRRLQHFEDARLIVQQDAALLFCCFPKLD